MADKKISQLSAASTPLAGTEVLPIVQSSTTVKVATDDLTVKNVRSNATTGILQIAGPAAAATRTMTVPDANFTAARTDAAQTFTGDQTFGTVLATTFDTNVAAAGVTLAGTTLAADGTDTNISVTVTPKGTGNLVLTSGNLAVANGAGIDFSASSHTAGMESELLNDYEAGTFVTSITAATSGTITLSGSWNRFAYTKIGRAVHITGALIVSSVASPVGTVRISLPFTCANLSAGSGTGAIAIACNNLVSVAGANVVGIFQETFDYLEIYSGASTSFAALGAEIQANTEFYIACTYFTS